MALTIFLKLWGSFRALNAHVYVRWACWENFFYGDFLKNLIFWARFLREYPWGWTDFLVEKSKIFNFAKLVLTIFLKLSGSFRATNANVYVRWGCWENFFDCDFLKNLIFWGSISQGVRIRKGSGRAGKLTHSQGLWASWEIIPPPKTVRSPPPRSPKSGGLGARGGGSLTRI